jgi:peptidyl-tRNA hydrolase, PTH1 family
MIRLFVGLGNPGAEYEATRHNAGFWFIDELARQWKCSLSMDKGYHGLVARTSQGGQNVWLLQPQTFMNLSGKSVGALARFFKIKPEEILVIYDELDVVPGEAKVKLGGSSTHNGLRSISELVGADYWRLRIGIGHPGVKSEVLSWVLQKPSQEQRSLIDETIARCLKAVPHFLAGEIDKATQIVHTAKPPRPKPPRQVISPAPTQTLPNTPSSPQKSASTNAPEASDSLSKDEQSAHIPQRLKP